MVLGAIHNLVVLQLSGDIKKFVPIKIVPLKLQTNAKSARMIYCLFEGELGGDMIYSETLLLVHDSSIGLPSHLMEKG